MKPFSRPPRSRSLLTVFSLSSLLCLEGQAQITANDDGAPGSAFATTGEDAAITGGASVTANDTGTFDVISTNVTSANGVPVTIEDSSGTIGQYTYDPTLSPLAQALAASGSFEDTFTYEILEISGSSPVAGITNELDPTLSINSTGWAGLPTTIAPGAGAPSSFTSVYDYSGTTATSTRAAFTTSSWQTAPVSLEFWVKQDTLQDVTLWETGGSGTGSGVFLTAAGNVKWVVKTSATQTILDSTATMSAGAWHHIVITLDTSTGESIIYLDGAAAGTATAAGNNNWSGGNAAGLGGVNSDAGGDSGNPGNLATWRNPFNGQLGLFRFYSGKVLSLAEVQQNRNVANQAVVTDTANVTIEVTGANDIPRGTIDVFKTPIIANAPTTVTRGLTANDGVPGSGLINLLASDLPGLTTSQSPSVGAPPGGGVPERAFDQNFRRFTHTDSNNNTVDHTWSVDFGEDVFLDSTVLYNRADCCGERLRDITVTVQDSSGTTIFTSPLLNPANAFGFTGASGGTLEVDFGGITGRSITVTRTPDLGDANVSNGSILSLGEVIVRGRASSPGDALLLNYDARYEADDNRWCNLGSSENSTLDWVLGSGVTHNASVVSARSQISAALEWDGTSTAIGTYPGVSISNALGAAVDQAGATVEAWVKLKAADLSQISTIFETGGGTGFGIVVDNGVLKAACDLDGGANNQSAVSYDLVGDSLGVLGGSATTAEFFQVAASIRPQGGVSLYVNGLLVDETTSGNAADWDGGDASGLGHFQGSNHGGFVNTAATANGGIYNTFFNGSMAIFRIYSAALEDVDVYEAFKAVDESTDIDGDSISVDGVVDAGGSILGLGTPANTAAGGIVTINNASGEFTYDPNGQFGFLAQGQTATDSFVYQVDDGNGAKGYAEVIVTVTGVSDAVPDAYAVLDGQIQVFTDNALVGNDQPFAPASGAYLDFSSATLTSSVWTNAGSSGFNTAPTGPIVSGLNISTGFGAIGPALGNGGGTMNSLDPISTTDATIEVWFRPDPGQTGKFTIFESGGNGNGFSIVYDADAGSVTATVDGGIDLGLPDDQTIQATAGGVSTSEFNQLIVVYDRDGGAEVGAPSGIFEDLLTVYLNNDPSVFFDATVDGTGVNLNGTANDWCGSDGGALNGLNNTSALDENLPGPSGLVGGLRVYSRILTTPEMAQNYNAALREITAIDAVTALGATVTDNLDGTFTYDPTGLAPLAPGESVLDSFSYTTDNGLGGSTSAIATFALFGSANQQPTGDLDSTVVYTAGAPAVKIIPPISADDPDGGFGFTLVPTFAASSAISTTLTDPGNGGASVIVDFTLAPSDVAPGANRVLYEIGGTSNGQGVYLIDGVPYFIAKMDGVNTAVPGGLALDADWDGDNLVLVPLAGGTLTSGVATELTLSFTGSSLTWDFNGGGATTQALSNLDGRTNWSGDDTLGFGERSNGNGGLADAAGPFEQTSFLAIDGTINGGGFANSPEESVTLTMTMLLTEGSFTAPAGSSFTDDGTTGTWTATGTPAAVRDLLLQVEFIPNGTSTSTANVDLRDGEEDGAVPVAGTVIFTDTGDADDLDTLLEYAFGTDPTVADANPLALDGSSNGTPIVDADFSGPSVEFSAVFVRRDDFGSPGSVNYTVEFSSDLVTWSPSSAAPVQVADSTDDPDYEVVKVPYPFFTPDGKKARYFRVRVTAVN